MDKSFSMQQNMGLQSDGEADEFKRVLLEGNPILLVWCACGGEEEAGMSRLTYSLPVGEGRGSWYAHAHI